MLPEYAQHAEPGIGEGTRKALESASGGLDSVLRGDAARQIQGVYHPTQWFAEKNFYHRKDGRIVKKRDHLMDASRYLWISRRFAFNLRPTKQPGAVSGRPGRRYDRANRKTIDDAIG